METKYIWIGVAILAIVLVFVGPQLKEKTQEVGKAILNIKLSVIEPDVKSVIVVSPKVKADVTTVPFSLTVINGGSVTFTNIRMETGTIPSVLATAFSGKTITTLAPGASGVMVANVDVTSLAPTTGSQITNFQACLKADYVVSGTTFYKAGCTEVLPLTIMPGAGIAVTVTYE